MYDIPVFAAERELGLEQAIRSQGSITFASQASLCEPFSLVASVEELVKATNLNQPDLHYLKSILVTAGWDIGDNGLPVGFNKNYDFFDTAQVWPARHTPEDKPVNYQHDETDVVGHITSNYCINAKGEVVAEDTTEDKLPGTLHVVTGAVLYKVHSDKARQERMNKVLAEMAEGKWFVSMEAYFKTFDYVLVANGSAKAVTRDNNTAFLTKHLKAYGGTGEYEGQKVGRLMKQIVFSGKGLVTNPANPGSVIFANAKIISDFNKTSGYSKMNENTESVKTMADTESLQKRITELEAKLAENDTKHIVLAKEKAEAETVELKKKLVESQELLAKANESIKTVTDNASKTAEKLTETEAKLKTVAEECAALKAEKIYAGRVKLVMDKLKQDETKAKAFVNSLSELSEAKFAEHVEAMAAWVDNNPQDGNTKFAAPAVKTPPQATPAKLPPKATPAKAEETQGEQNADTTKLDQVEETKSEPALAVAASDEVKNVQKQIAEFFGYKPQEDK